MRQSTETFPETQTELQVTGELMRQHSGAELRAKPCDHLHRHREGTWKGLACFPGRSSHQISTKEMYPNTIKAVFDRSNANTSFDGEKSIFSTIRNKLG